MVRVLLLRLVFFLAPFAAYWLWRERSRRTGAPMGSTPWGWLVGAGGLLVALSLAATALVRPNEGREVYIPAEAYPDGHVDQGRSQEVPPAR